MTIPNERQACNKGKKWNFQILRLSRSLDRVVTTKNWALGYSGDRGGACATGCAAPPSRGALELGKPSRESPEAARALSRSMAAAFPLWHFLWRKREEFTSEQAAWLLVRRSTVPNGVAPCLDRASLNQPSFCCSSGALRCPFPVEVSRIMPHYQTWEEFTRAAEKLYLSDPMKVTRRRERLEARTAVAEA